MKKKNLSFLLLFAFSCLLIISSLISCSDSTSGPGGGDTGAISFLMGHYKGGELGDKHGLVLVSSSGAVTWVSDYYPHYMSTDYVDMKNGRIAFYCENPPKDVSQIAYMDVDDIENIKFIPIPKSEDEDHYWEVKNVRPQVMSDGRIIIKVSYETVNPYDDAHSGMLAIYDPVTDKFEMSGDIGGFVLSQPEKGDDTEDGSMGGSFALSPDDKFVCLDAYGFGTNWGTYHVDYKFLVKYDIQTKQYSRIAQTANQVLFVTADNQYVVVNSEGKKKRYDAHINNTEGFLLDEYYEYVCVGQCSRKNELFFKTWSGGIHLFDVYTGGLYSIILRDSLTGPYRGLETAQFSTDEKYIYFMLTSDYYTNGRTEFAVMRTPSDYGKTNPNPDSLFIMPPEYDRDMFLVINK